MIFFALLILTVVNATNNSFLGRTIYQLLTDRFASRDEKPCLNLSDYCGGSYESLVEHLNYIEELGADALWISPVVKNTVGGYHGYWLENLYETNPHFGTNDSLQQFVSEAHRHSMKVVVDVVANHIGPNTTFKSITPFSDPTHYHSCSAAPCQATDCSIEQFQCFDPQTLLCRLDGLPDLNQSEPFVRHSLLAWVGDLVKKYKFDALRIDTVMEVNPEFWKEFLANANVDWAVGEVDTGVVSCNAAYAHRSGLPPLAYPLFYCLRSVFAQGQSMFNIRTTLNQLWSQLPEPDLSGVFIDNHDHPRFLHVQPNVNLYKGALLFVLFSRGIPIIYYGTEQHFHGGSDPKNRECLWSSNYATDTELFGFLKSAISVRKAAQVWQFPYVERYVAKNFYAFSRGSFLIAVTNTLAPVKISVTYLPWTPGQRVCNLLSPTSCTVIEQSGLVVSLFDGMPAIFGLAPGTP